MIKGICCLLMRLLSLLLTRFCGSGAAGGENPTDRILNRFFPVW